MTDGQANWQKNHGDPFFCATVDNLSASRLTPGFTNIARKWRATGDVNGNGSQLLVDSE
jgi:hypothetical protein